MKSITSGLAEGVGPVFAFRCLHQQLPIPFADALEAAVFGVVKELVAHGLGVALQQRGDIHAVNGAAGGKRRAGEGGDGGEQVDGGGERITHRARRNASGCPHDAGHALTALEGADFAVAQRTGGAAVVLEAEPGAVVGGENDIGVIREFQLAQQVEDATHLGVEVLDGVDVGAFGIGVADVVGHIERDVRHRIGQVEEERALLVFLDEGDAAIRAAAGDGALVHREFDDLLVLHQRGLPFREGGLRVLP